MPPGPGLVQLREGQDKYRLGAGTRELYLNGKINCTRKLHRRSMEDSAARASTSARTDERVTFVSALTKENVVLVSLLVMATNMLRLSN